MYRSSKLMNSTRTIAKVVTISSDALKKVVSDGILTVDSEAVNDKLNVFEGMKFDRGYIFPYFMNTAKGIAPGFSDNRQHMAIAISSLRLYSTISLDLHEQLMKEKDEKIVKLAVEKIVELAVEKSALQTNLDILRKEVSQIKSPEAAKSKIEFYERENGLLHYDLTEDEKKIIMKISDPKEREIKAVEFKWLFLLSEKNPNFKLEMNQDLLRIFHEKGISIDRACRAIAVTFEHTASRWHELFDMNGEPIVVLKVKQYDDVIQCFF